MSKFAILSTLAIGATALVVVAVVTPAKAATSHGEHIKKHARVFAWSPGAGDSWSTGQVGSTGQAGPVTRPSGRAGGGCPGLARSIDCATWPPPFDEDADRKSGDGGGG
jgi:hypothetical protein